MSDTVRLTDNLGIIGIDGTEYQDRGSQQTTVATDLLKQGVEILDTLGWEEVDVCTVEPTKGEQAPMLVLRPPRESMFSGDQAGIAICPRLESNRDDD